MAYARHIADIILERLAEGESLNATCRIPGMPQASTVRRWGIDNIDGFSERYERALDLGFDARADRILDIADGIDVQDESLFRSRLRIDAYKWYLSKRAHKKYGDRLHTELSNPDGSLQPMSPAQIAAGLNQLASTAAINSTGLDDDDDGTPLY